jgi:hypothetical protein
MGDAESEKRAETGTVEDCGSALHAAYMGY